MLDEKDVKVIKDKACQEITKLRQKMENQNDVAKADWESLVLALKAYEKVLNIEHMEMTGYSGYGYSRDGYSDRGRDRMGRYSSDYSGHYDNRDWEDMLSRLSPREREWFERMLRR